MLYFKVIYDNPCYYCLPLTTGDVFVFKLCNRKDPVGLQGICVGSQMPYKPNNKILIS